MENEEAKQLVILGNGFDLNLGLATKFKDYMKRFYFYDEENEDEKKELDNLFKDLIDWSGYIVENLEKNDMDEGCFEDKVNEIIDYMDDIKNNSEEKKLVLNFYIKARYNQLKKKVIPMIENLGKIYPNNSIKYDNRIESLKKLSEEMLKRYKTNDDTDKIENKKQLNFWDLYLLYLRKNDDINEDSNWSDVEAQILIFYKESNNEPSKYNELVSQKNTTLSTIYTTLTGKRVNPNDIDNFLYNELIRFSQNFVDYLKDQYSQCYYGRDDYILNNRWKFIDEKIANNKKYELLNFNYTNAEGYGCVKQIHIHGDKDKNIETPIIGINAEDLKDEDFKSNKKHAFKLTKQYQLISNKNNKIERLDLENIDRIIFYGHSLALADYQYFRNIFDRINLVKSSVQLIFKYSIYNEKIKEDILKEKYNQIFELLKRYSDDVNVDVITTLMLDGRLKLQEI